MSAGHRCSLRFISLHPRSARAHRFIPVHSGSTRALRVPAALFVSLSLLSAARVARGAEPPPVSLGGEIRLRGEALENARDLRTGGPDSTAFYHDSYQFYRMRYRLWADARPRENLRIYLRLGNEYRWGGFANAVDATGNVGEVASIRDPESRVSLDNGWAEIQFPASTALRFKFGRMDMMYGEGFLIFDGTPFDGSSSAYFDGMTLSWKYRALTADLLMAKLQDEAFGTKARDEDLYGLYTRRGAFDAYLLHRSKYGPSVSSSGVVHPRQYTSALGGRFARTPDAGWQVATEAALEFGKYWGGPGGAAGQSANRLAGGGYFRGGFNSGARLRPGFELGGLYLTGDDPATSRYEGWDDFYGEWPKYSELYIYTLYDYTTRAGITGTRPASPDDAGAWTNLEAGWAEARFWPLAAMRLAARGTLLGAPQKTGNGGGGYRGTLLTGTLDWTLAPGVAGQLWGEYFHPGSFYSPLSDGAWYGRAQITTRF